MNLRAAALIALTAATAAIAPATASAQAGTPCPDADLAPSVSSPARAGAATLCLVNQQRAAAGLNALKAQPTLGVVAQRYASKMAAQNFFDHVSPDGSTLTLRVNATRYLKGARAWGLAENIAWGEGALATPAAIVTSWMGSAGHRANIMDAGLRELGVGVALDAPIADVAGPAATYVHDFGRRR